MRPMSLALLVLALFLLGAAAMITRVLPALIALPLFAQQFGQGWVRILALALLGVGSLEPGKQATFLITTGTPLDMTSDIEQAYIQGRELDMMDIQKFFFEKYMVKVMQYLRVVM